MKAIIQALYRLKKKENDNYAVTRPSSDTMHSYHLGEQRGYDNAIQLVRKRIKRLKEKNGSESF